MLNAQRWQKGRQPSQVAVNQTAIGTTTIAITFSSSSVFISQGQSQAPRKVQQASDQVHLYQAEIRYRGPSDRSRNSRLVNAQDLWGRAVLSRPKPTVLQRLRAKGTMLLRAISTLVSTCFTAVLCGVIQHARPCFVERFLDT
jgi:hypothetical protein